MVTIQSGAVKFRSVKSAYEAATKRNPKLKWMTYYMRIRMGMSHQQAASKKPRKYVAW